MNQELSGIITSILPTIAIIALLVAVVATIFWAKKSLPNEYRWEIVFRDLLVGNLGDRKKPGIRNRKSARS
jgi:hypothetical protein